MFFNNIILNTETSSSIKMNKKCCQYTSAYFEMCGASFRTTMRVLFDDELTRVVDIFKFWDIGTFIPFGGAQRSWLFE